LSDPIVRRLINWGRFYRVSKLPKHCGSVEWHFVQHRGLTEGEEEYRRTSSPPVDARDAALVEKAWTQVAESHRDLLLQRYVWRSRDDRICQRLGIPTNSIDGVLVYFVIALRSAHDAIRRELDLNDLVVQHARRQPENSVERL
jgi:hypothetical protein